MSESPAGPGQPETPSYGTTPEEPLSGDLSRRLEQLQRELSAVAEEAAAAASRQAVSRLLQAVARIDDAGTQTDVLTALLEGGCRFASRTAFFLTRSDKIRGWASHGFGRAASKLEGLELDPVEGAWADLSKGTGIVELTGDECADLSNRLDAAGGIEGVLVPFVLRGQLGGALYADRLEGDGGLGVAGLQLLVHAAAQALETVAFRKGASPALRRSETDAQGVPLWKPAARVDAETPEAEEEPQLAAESVEEPVAESIEEPVAEDEPQLAAESVEEPVAESVEEPMAEDEPQVAAESAEEPVAEEPVAEDEPQLAAESAEEPAAEDEPQLAAEEAADDEASSFLRSEPEPEVSEPVTPELETAPDEAFEPEEEELAEAPEPELEDDTDIWALEEDDEEPTQVGVSIPEVAQEPPAAEPPAALAEAVGQQTVRLDLEALQGRPPSVTGQEFRPPSEPGAPEPPDIAAEAPAAAPEPPAMTPEAPPGAPEPPPAEDASEEPTIITSKPLGAEAPPPVEGFAAPATSGFVPPPAPEPEPKQEPAGGTSQVVPPADLQGPGLAFRSGPTTDLDEGEEALHEEARRLARLLVSEIKLYNEEIIEEGRRHGDVYERLKDDIDRSRQMYEERIDPRLHGKEDYFHQELVQRLAGGDKSLLGM